MKKVLLAAAVAGLAMASCKKDYTCTCNYMDNGTAKSFSYDMKDVKKKDAKNTCNTFGAAQIAQGGTCDYK